MYKDEFNVHNFLAHPDVLIWQALTLRYKPVDLDVLPLYITLVFDRAVRAVVPWCAARTGPWLGSVLLYIGARIFDWNLASYPPGTHWYFNPFAWQLMFVFAAWCGIGGIAQIWSVDPVARGADHGAGVDRLRVPDRDDLAQRLPGCDGAEMDDQADLSDRQDRSRHAALHPLPRAGAGGLAVFSAQLGNRSPRNGCVRWCCAASIRCRYFCFGVFLSFGAHWILVQYPGGVWRQIVLSFGGMAIMTGACMASGPGREVPEPVRRRQNPRRRRRAGRGPAKA